MLPMRSLMKQEQKHQSRFRLQNFMISILSSFCFYFNFLLIKILCQYQQELDIGIATLLQG